VSITPNGPTLTDSKWQNFLFTIKGLPYWSLLSYKTVVERERERIYIYIYIERERERVRGKKFSNTDKFGR